MEQKTKFIIIGLIGITVVSFFLLIATVTQKQQLLREKEDLKKENTSLSSKIDNLETGLRDSKNKVDSLKRDLDTISRDKLELERRYDLVNRAKDDLVEKLKDLQSKQGSVERQQIQALPQSDAYWAGVLKAKTDLELQLGNLSNQFRSVQITNEQLQRDKSAVEIQISNIKREREDIARELEYNKKILDSISQELVRERSDKIQIQDNFKIIKSENTILTRQLEALNSRKIDLEKKYQDLQQDKGEVERRFSDMQSMLTDRISQINGLKEELDAIRKGESVGSQSLSPQAENKGSVELPPIVVRPQTAESSKDISASLQGRVLALNKESNFVIIDLGEDSGVKVGDTFHIYHGDNDVSTVEAIQVRKNISACDIKRQTESVVVGDSVR